MFLLNKMASKKCIFCDIIAGAQPADVIYQDDEIIIFKDIKPAAKFHYLAVPKLHIENADKLTFEQKPLLEKLINDSKNVLQQLGGDVNDVRMGFHWPPFNSIPHLHLHVISPASEMGVISRLVFKPNTWWFITVDYLLEKLIPNKL